MSSRIRSRRLKAAAAGAAGVMAALCLTITPAQADSPGGGGSLMPDSGVGSVPESTDDWSTREGLAKYLSGCGESCTFVPLEKVGEPTYGTPTRVGNASQNCSPSETAAPKYEEAETISETLTIGLSIDGISAVTPKIEQSWMKSNTVSNALTGTLAPYQTGWFEEVPVTQKAKGTWKIDGVSETNPFGAANKYTAVGPREFHDVESDITYKIIRFNTKNLTEDEKKNLCGKDGPV
ncbi:hypothetical protein [Streptomyces sp. NPDC048637]|uniref:hypothetical protein n=1 Tax=Streptomyces sp. NPDC048637 TaxID=3155636 RepID=UPI00342A9B2E